MKVKFVVSAPSDVSCQLLVVGSLNSLGCWDPNKAVMLVDNRDGRLSATIEVVMNGKRGEQKEKIEFKLVKKYYDGRVEWENLPNNSNRRITIKEDVVLFMQWSNPLGEKKKMPSRKISSSSAPSMVLNQPIRRDTTMSLDSFDPFKIAEHSDEQEERSVEKEVAALGQHLFGRKQFQELFYSNFKSPFLVKAHEGSPHCDIFVVSRLHPQQSQRLNKFRQSLFKVDSKVQWLVEYRDNHQQKQNNITFVALRNKVGGLTDATLRWLFQRYLDELIPENSIVFILDDIFNCLKINQSSLKLTLLGDLEILESDILNDQNIEESVKNSLIDKLHKTDNPIQTIYDSAMSENLWKSAKVTSNNKLAIDEFQWRLEMHQNCIMIIDWEVLEKCLLEMEKHFGFLDQLRKISWQRGKFICVVSERSREQIEPKLAFLIMSNITFVFSNGRQVRLNGLWMNPFDKLHNTTELVRKKMLKFQKFFGGVYSRAEKQFVYNHTNSDILNKLCSEIKEMMVTEPGEEEKYVKVVVSEKKLVVSWEQDLDNVLEVILRLNCMSEGTVGFIFNIVCDNKKTLMFDKVNYFTKMYPYFFTHHCRKIFACQSTEKLRRGRSFISLDELKSLKFIL